MTDTILDPDNHLLLCDIETTGLDPKDDIILEVGFMVTDLSFRPVNMFHSLIQPGYEVAWELCDDFVQKVHEKSGLRDEIDAGKGDELESVDIELRDWYTELFGGVKVPLVGSSVHFDRGFLTEHLVEFPSLVHYRNIDFSSVKELCRRYNPEVYAKLPDKREIHRAIPDLEDTIGEARFYVENFLHTTRPEW